jgi:hypothetical protein
MNKIGRIQTSTFFVDTCKVFDSELPYETAIASIFYNNNELMIVEMYEYAEDAKIGHEKWVAIMSKPFDELPEIIQDGATNIFAQMAREVDPTSMIYKKEREMLN